MQLKWKEVVWCLWLPLWAYFSAKKFKNIILDKFNVSNKSEILDICEDALELLKGQVYCEPKKCVNSNSTQWIRWGISATKVNWKFNKPGVYASSVMKLVIVGNGELSIDFEGFENLRSSSSPEQFLETYWGFTNLCSNENINDVIWIPAEELNNHEFHIKDEGYWCKSWKIWNKVVVKSTNTSSEYKNEATITFTLKNTKIWEESPLKYYPQVVEIPSSFKTLK